MLNKTIRGKVSLSIFLSTAVALFAVVVFLVTYEASALRHQFVTTLEQKLSILSEAMAPALVFDDPEKAQQVLNTLKEDNTVISARVYHNSGDSFVGFNLQALSKQPFEAIPIQMPLQQQFMLDGSWLHMIKPIAFKGEVVGYIYVKEKIPGIAQKLSKYLFLLSLVGASLFIAAFLISWIVEKYISQRIRSLVEIAQEVTLERDYARRVFLKGRDEISDLAGAMNDLFYTVEQEMQRNSSVKNQLMTNQSRLRQYLDNLPIALLVINKKQDIIYINNKTCELFDIRHNECDTIDDLMAKRAFHCPKTQTIIQKYSLPFLKALTSGEKSVVEVRFYKNDKPLSLEISANPVFALNGKIDFSITAFADVTGRVNAQRRISHLAHHDPLTEVVNRRGLQKHLKKSILSAKQTNTLLALMFIDIDLFKTINDSFGHVVADLMLKDMAHRLKNMVRQEDIVSRFGGDEFAILLKEIHHVDETKKIATKILKEITRPYPIRGQELICTASMGVSHFPVDAHSEQELMRCSDSAMYFVKNRGRNNICFYTHDIDSLIKSKREIQKDLKLAIKNKQLFFCYQPQIEAHTGNLLGFETLIRWRHPTKGVITPDHFIPIAEESGLISKIGQYTVDHVFEQIACWKRLGMTGVNFSINLSPVHFRQESLIGMIKEAVQRWRIDPHIIEIEITENVFFEATPATQSALVKLKQLGFMLSIDDFGTGYSSLSYLSRLSVDKLKIDQSFVKSIHMNSANGAIVSAVIALAKALDIKVIAEGVETQLQAKWLQDKGCEQFQGYLFGHPMESDATEKFLYRVGALEYVTDLMTE